MAVTALRHQIVWRQSREAPNWRRGRSSDCLPKIADGYARLTRLTRPDPRP